MKTCEYKFRDGRKCAEMILKDSNYCILHIELPEDKNAEEFKIIANLKKKKVKEKVAKGDYNFEGAKLYAVDFRKKHIEGDLIFSNCKIETSANFDDTKITGRVWFLNAKIGEHLSFDGAMIEKEVLCPFIEVGGTLVFHKAEIRSFLTCTGGKINNVWFDEAIIKHLFVDFSDTNIEESFSYNNAKIDATEVVFDNAVIGLSIDFKYSEINSYINFDNATIHFVEFQGSNVRGEVSFDDAKILSIVWFDDAAIEAAISFNRSKINELSLKNTKFKKPLVQEQVCRKAKIIYDNLGNRVKADHYFYREMEGKRKQKSKIARNLELPVQYIFAYGTKARWVLLTWFLVMFSLAFIFWIGDGIKGIEIVSFLDYIYFSIVTITTLGYGDFQPKPGLFRILASCEAVFGTFMWAAFIAIFARRYMSR